MSTVFYFAKNAGHDPTRVLKYSLENTALPQDQLYYATIYFEGRYCKQDTDGCGLKITKVREGM